jgi:predicted acyl esterase
MFTSRCICCPRQSQGTTSENYTEEVQIKMRDGATLFTAIYAPKTVLKNTLSCNAYIQLCAVWRETEFKRALVQMKPWWKEKVTLSCTKMYADAGWWWFVWYALLSLIKGKTQVDEASIHYDTIDWLVKNVQQITEMWAFRGVPWLLFYLFVVE